jgi:hypothetical protein
MTASRVDKQSPRMSEGFTWGILLWDTLRKLFPFFLSKKPQKEAKTA